MADIGDKLRSARKAKSMSIEDVEKITKIQRRYLTAIENDDFDQLPGDFYVRAFIRQFADVVGLNGKELLADYKSEVPEAKPEEYVENSIDNKSERIKETTNNRKGIWRSYMPQIATVVGIVLVILVVYIVYTRFFTGTNQQSANQAENVTVSSSRIKSSKSKTSSKAKSTSKSATSEVKISSLGNNSYRVSGMKNDRTLTLGTTKNEVWAQILVNGSSVWQGTLKANGKHSVQLPQNVNNVSVQMGNSVSTTLSLAGKNVNAHNATNPASPMTVRFTFADQSSQSSSAQQSSATTQSSTVTNTTTTQTQQNQNTQNTQNVQNTQGQTTNTNTTQNNGGQSNR